MAAAPRAPRPGEGLHLSFSWSFGGDRHSSMQAFCDAVVAENQRIDPERARTAARELDLILTTSAHAYVTWEGLDRDRSEYEAKALKVTASAACGLTLGDLLWQVGEAAHDDMAEADHRYPEAVFRSTAEQAREQVSWVPEAAAVLQDPNLPTFSIECGS